MYQKEQTRLSPMNYLHVYINYHVQYTVKKNIY